MSKYSSIVATGTDAAQNQNRRLLTGIDYQIINVLPFPVKLLARTGEQEPRLVITLAPRATGHVADRVLHNGDSLHVLTPIKGKDGVTRDYVLLRSVFLVSDTRVLKRRDIQYDYVAPGYSNVRSDTIGLRIHNHLIYPINIIFDGNIVGTAEGDDGLSYMGGSTNSVYLTNNWDGFSMGDKFTIETRSGIFIATVTLPDNFVTDIYVGVLGSHYSGTPIDTYSYRLDGSNWTGIAQYPLDQTYSVFRNPRDVPL